MDTRLTSNDVCVLDQLMVFLRSVAPWFQSSEADACDDWPRVGEQEELVVAVCGNWYDVPHKAPVLHKAASLQSSADLLLTGGRSERLTPMDAVEAGGEPLLLQKTLCSQYGIPSKRIVIYSGSRVTNHNLCAMLHYAKQVHEFTQRIVKLHVVEEGFLLRREAAALVSQLREDSIAAAVVADVHFTAVGPQNFQDLVAVHSGRTDVALALVVGEYDRLQRYSNPGTDTTATHGLVRRGVVLDAGALDALDTSLRESLLELHERHKDGLLAAGRNVLEHLPREEMLLIATPLSSSI